MGASVMLTVRGVDGDMLLGPESLPDRTTVADVKKRLLAEKTETADVEILQEEHKLEESTPLQDIEREGAVELNAVFTELVIKETFQNANYFETVRLEVAPGSREALEAAVTRGDPPWEIDHDGSQLKTI